MKHILAVYQWCVAMPILLVMTIITALLTIFFSLLGMSRRGGYYPAHFWAKLWCILMFVKVEVKGRENIDPQTSYVFVANHQGAYDIYLVYGYLNHNFKWMMKKSLEKNSVCRRSLPHIEAYYGGPFVGVGDTADHGQRKAHSEGRYVACGVSRGVAYA